MLYRTHRGEGRRVLAGYGLFKHLEKFGLILLEDPDKYLIIVL